MWYFINTYWCPELVRLRLSQNRTFSLYFLIKREKENCQWLTLHTDVWKNHILDFETQQLVFKLQLKNLCIHYFFSSNRSSISEVNTFVIHPLSKNTPIGSLVSRFPFSVLPDFKIMIISHQHDKKKFRTDAFNVKKFRSKMFDSSFYNSNVYNKCYNKT